MHSITQFTKQLACLGMVSYFSVKPENTSRSVWLFLLVVKFINDFYRLPSPTLVNKTIIY